MSPFLGFGSGFSDILEVSVFFLKSFFILTQEFKEAPTKVKRHTAISFFIKVLSLVDKF
jgi:hypothetical protein